MTSQTVKVALPGSVRRPLQGARLIGPVDPQEALEVTVYARRNPQADPLPAVDEFSLTPPRLREYFSRATLAEAHGADHADLQAIAQFAGDCGLEPFGLKPGQRAIRLRGNAGNFMKAFDVPLHRWGHASGDYRGRTGPIHVPHGLHGVIHSVLGLDNRRIGYSYLRSARQPTLSRSVASPTPFLPTRLAQLYDFPGQVDGTGQVIAVLAFNGQIADSGSSAPGGYDPNVLQNYFSQQVQVTPPQITNVVVHGPGNQAGDGTDPNDASGEIMLDLQVVGSVAPGAKIVVYFTEFTEQGWVDAIQTIVHDTDNNPRILSCSYGNAETASDAGTADQRGSLWTNGAIEQANSAFQVAALAGMSICCASGDAGSPDGDSDGLSHVDFPASSPYVLGCGGTRVTSARGAISRERVWNDGPGSAGGGGISDLFPLPSWQENAGVPASVNPGHRIGRGVPDVASDADPNTGLLIADNTGKVQPIGGTSAAAPLWAALLARINQGLGAPVGFLNPLLYTPAVSGALQDITQGDNGAYRAGPGWDACTGLGRPDGARLLQALGTGASASAGVPAATAQEVERLRTRIADMEQLLRTRPSLTESLPGELRLVPPQARVDGAAKAGVS